jgi:hypothetical protein
MQFEEVRRKLVDEFEPCRVISTSGHEYTVRHPDCALVGPFSVAILDKDGFMVTLSLDHVTAIKVEPPKNVAKKR